MQVIYIYILWCPPGDDTVSFGLPFIAVPWYIAVRWLSTLLNITIWFHFKLTDVAVLCLLPVHDALLGWFVRAPSSRAVRHPCISCCATRFCGKEHLPRCQLEALGHHSSPRAPKERGHDVIRWESTTWTRESWESSQSTSAFPEHQGHESLSLFICV